ncbi:hypothetical protein F4680DRAFT_67643 [Xylaria scruposa]|nr:hypothetical protein F4680DRAFT_67643 [Xylaria scruposa]
MSYSNCEIFDIEQPGYRNDRPNILTAKVLKFRGLKASQVEFLFARPNVEVLEFHSCYWDIWSEGPTTTRTMVHAIKLVDTAVDDSGLNDILRRFPGLRSLVYFRPQEEVDTGLHELGRELVKYGQNLEHLELYNDSLMPFYSPFGSLQKLINLKTLEIDLELLIGFRDNPRGYDDYGDDEYLDIEEVAEQEEPDYEEINRYAGDWSLVKLLPPSLEKLTLHIEQPKLEVYFNTYERYGAKFEELMTAKGQFDKLRWVQAPRLNTVAEKLCRKSTGWALIGESKHIMARTPLRTEAGADASDSSVADTETIAK